MSASAGLGGCKNCGVYGPIFITKVSYSTIFFLDASFTPSLSVSASLSTSIRAINKKRRTALDNRPRVATTSQRHQQYSRLAHLTDGRHSPRNLCCSKTDGDNNETLCTTPDLPIDSILSQVRHAMPHSKTSQNLVTEEL